PDEENKKWSSPISKVVNVVTSGLSKLKFWAKGTNYHPGGPAVLGEEGPELVEHGGKTSLASFGIYDLPIGAKVRTHEDTVNMLRSWLVSGIGRGLSLQNANSSFSVNEFNDKNIVNVLLKQNQILIQLLNKETNLVLDSKLLAKKLEPNITNRQNRKQFR